MKNLIIKEAGEGVCLGQWYMVKWPVVCLSG